MSRLIIPASLTSLREPSPQLGSYEAPKNDLEKELEIASTGMEDDSINPGNFANHNVNRGILYSLVPATLVTLIAFSSPQAHKIEFPNSENPDFQTAVNHSADGDTLIGRYNGPNGIVGKVKFDPEHGIGGRNLTILGRGETTPIIKFPNGQYNALIDMFQAGNLTMRNFVLDGIGQAALLINNWETPALLDSLVMLNSRAGIRFNNSNGALLQNSSIQNLGVYGIDADYSNAGLRNVSISEGSQPPGARWTYNGDWGTSMGATFDPFENVHGDYGQAGGNRDGIIGMKAYVYSDRNIPAIVGVNYFPTQDVIAYLAALMRDHPNDYQSQPIPFLDDGAIHGDGDGSGHTDGRVQWWINSAGIRGENYTKITDTKVFPNPSMEGFVNIEYTLKEDGPVQITMYDTQGRSLGVLFEGNERAGNQKHLLFPGADSKLSSGQYYLSVHTPGGDQMEKFQILK